ncbi:hypothetical protein L1887_05059 [Cichorium endivia]|nr:hypothetical protein L1887_05059 [Cichorium endivia]
MSSLSDPDTTGSLDDVSISRAAVFNLDTLTSNMSLLDLPVGFSLVVESRSQPPLLFISSWGSSNEHIPSLNYAMLATAKAKARDSVGGSSLRAVDEEEETGRRSSR